MKSTIIASVLLLATTAVAQPHRARHQHQHIHEKRDVVYVTDFETVTETIESTETVWVTPGAPAPTSVSAPSTTLATTTSPVPAQFFQPSTTAVIPVPTTSPSVLVLPAPAPTNPIAVAPVSIASTTEAAPAPKPTTVAPPVVVPTTLAPVPVVVPTTTTPAPPSTTAGGYATAYTGDITYYDTTGYGACGWINDGTKEDVIALPFGFMGTLSNSNPYCGKMVTITLGSVSVVAKVVDKCMGCTGMSIDLSHHAFDQLAKEGVGRTTASWTFN